MADRVTSALNEVEDMVEVVSNVHVDPDFVEISGEIGGDLVKYRIYNDGKICAK